MSMDFVRSDGVLTLRKKAREGWVTHCMVVPAEGRGTRPTIFVLCLVNFKQGVLSCHRAMMPSADLGRIHSLTQVAEHLSNP